MFVNLLEISGQMLGYYLKIDNYFIPHSSQWSANSILCKLCSWENAVK